MLRTIQTTSRDKIVNKPHQLLAHNEQPAQRSLMENPQMDRAFDAAPPESPSPLALSLQALDRIEAALTRIENAAPACIARDTSLRRRHEELKASVAQSLSGLDELLAGRVSEERS